MWLKVCIPWLYMLSVHMASKAHVYLRFCVNLHLSVPPPGTDWPLLTTSLSRMRTCTVWSNTSSRRGCWPSTLWTQGALLCPGTVLEGTWQLLSRSRYWICVFFFSWQLYIIYIVAAWGNVNEAVYNVQCCDGGSLLGLIWSGMTLFRLFSRYIPSCWADFYDSYSLIRKPVVVLYIWRKKTTQVRSSAIWH